ncbi:MAG: histidine phosphatase family protein [Clostridia bacterium]|nr:histidine phosphatase family protein [Clostridia bacterium]
MATTLILIRHGESEANYEHRFTGQSNAFGLTARGHAQAEAAAVWLDGTTVDVIVASDLRRAYDTAKHLADRRGMTVIPDEGFREIFAGAWEGRKFSELPDAYPEDFGVWLDDIGSAVCTDGESVAALQTRVRAAVERIVRTYPGKTVVIGTHATPIRAMQCIWQNVPLCAMKDVPWVPNASVTSVVYEEDMTWHDVRIGQTAHLAGMETSLPQNV